MKAEIAFLVSIIVVAGLWIAALFVKHDLVRASLAKFAPLAVMALSLYLTQWSAASFRLAIPSLALLYSFKGSALLRLPLERIRGGNRPGLLYFSTIWPGIDPRPFLQVPIPTIEDPKPIYWGLVKVTIGILTIVLVAIACPNMESVVTDWTVIFAILLTFHLGFSTAFSEFTRTLGWKVAPLFDSPTHADSLSNFWSRRWNRPFVEMNKIFFMPDLVRWFGTKKAVFLTFLISGLLHEFAISFPAQGGWGGPTLYFAFQGSLIFLERKLRINGRTWVACAVLLPLPILFHGHFRSEVIHPLVIWLHQLIAGIGFKKALSLLITVLGISQFTVLAASFQVPYRLRWKEELARLSPLNRKLMWTYGTFIVFTITAFGVITLALHADILEGTRAGLAICIVIGLFWFLRLLTDMFYFRSSDWPSGRFMQIGHVLLNFLFSFVLIGYLVILTSHFLQVLS